MLVLLRFYVYYFFENVLFYNQCTMMKSSKIPPNLRISKIKMGRS